MDNVLILEKNPSDMKFLKTLQKYSDYNYYFIEEPGSALKMIEEKNIDVFVCPYELKGYNTEDILMTVNLMTNHPLCVLTSIAERIPELLNCLNSYSVFRMVIKPFMNILDIKSAIDDAVNRRASVGARGDDFLFSIIGDSKETDFWENHDRMIDYRYLKLFLGIYNGAVIGKKNKDGSIKENIKNNNEIFLVEMFLQDVWDGYMKTCVLNPPVLGRLNGMFNGEGSTDGKDYLGLNISTDVRKKYNRRSDLILAILIFREYLRHSLTEYNGDIRVMSDNGWILVKLSIVSEGNSIPEDDFIKREVEKLLSLFCYKYSLGTGESAYTGAAILKE
ncbi:MAG: hypothetical protein KBA87_01420 [Lachnospiraceae bacterium]|jgi:hypothetical protein|nr:hypothetical protein [Lachnospiraceae bacterium]